MEHTKTFAAFAFAGLVLAGCASHSDAAPADHSVAWFCSHPKVLHADEAWCAKAKHTEAVCVQVSAARSRRANEQDNNALFGGGLGDSSVNYTLPGSIPIGGAKPNHK